MVGVIKTVLNGIAGVCADIAGFFWDLYIRTSGDIIFDWTASWWRAIGRLFDELAFGFILFRDWCMNVADEIATFLDSWDIMALLAIPIKWALDAWNWVTLAWTNVWQIVNAWWGTMESTVLGWIDVAKEWAAALINIAQVGVNILMTTWDNFWTITWPELLADHFGLRFSWNNFLVNMLPGLATLTGVGSLVDSALREWLPFYNELVEIWGEILEFFTNPLDWIASRIESWFWEG